MQKGGQGLARHRTFVTNFMKAPSILLRLSGGHWLFSCLRKRDRAGVGTPKMWEAGASKAARQDSRTSGSSRPSSRSRSVKAAATSSEVAI